MRDFTQTTNSTDDSNNVRSTATPFTLESAYGSVSPSQSPEDFKEICRIAKDDKAERTVRKLSET